MITVNNYGIISPSLQSFTPFVNLHACGFVLVGKMIITITIAINRSHNNNNKIIIMTITVFFSQLF